MIDETEIFTQQAAFATQMSNGGGQNVRIRPLLSPVSGIISGCGISILIKLYTFKDKTFYFNCSLDDSVVTWAFLHVVNTSFISMLAMRCACSQTPNITYYKPPL